MSGDELHALVAGFANVAEAYDRGRPTYAPPVAEAIAEGIGAVGGLREGFRVLDLGAGTGLLSRALLVIGLDVVAVEPLQGMRQALARAIGPGRVLEGRAEAIPLGDAAVDGAVCGDAFHWFDGAAAAGELHRVVRPGGGVAIVWLSPSLDAEEVPAWWHDVGAELEPLRRAAHHPHLYADRRPTALEEHGGFSTPEHRRVSFVDITDRDGQLAHFASISFVGALPAGEREALLDRLGDILDRNGVTEVRRPHVAELWLTRRLPDPAPAEARPAAAS